MWEIDRLDAQQVREIFGADRRWFRATGFPASEPDDDGVQRWPADRVWAWLAAQQPEAAAVVPLRYWPRGDANYQRAQQIPKAIVQDWTIHGVTLRVVWPTVEASATGGTPAAAAHLAPRVPRVIMVRHDIGGHGPTLAVHDESGRTITVGETLWPELALVLGGRAPYWAYGLRDAEAMGRWRPGHPPIPVAASVSVHTAPDPVPLLRLAAAIPASETAHAALTALAAHTQYQASVNPAHTLDTITANPAMAPWIDVAATSMPVPEPADLDEVVLRDGWLAITARLDTLAYQAVREARKSWHGQWLPYSAAEYIDPATRLGAEWAARLQPTSPYAGFEVLYDHLTDAEQDTITEYLTDPATDAPVLRLTSGALMAAVPHRLPVNSPLSELTVGDPIWIRLADDTVHLAPRRDSPGISSGYAGSGTSTLALLITQLLDDPTAPAAAQIHGGAPGLEKLLQTAADGTTFTRPELDNARSSHGEEFR